MSIAAATLKAMLGKLAELGFLADCKCILTGYFADDEQVAVVADFIAAQRAERPDCYYLCDPVIGDDDELYVKQELAEAIRDRLLPMAQGLSPNAFEAGWLSGMSIHSIEDARHAARSWLDKDVIVTSLPESDDRLATAVFSRGGESVVSRPRLAHVPHGTGDLLSGLAAGHLAKGESIAHALPDIVDTLDRVIAASHGGDSLDLARGLRP